MTDVHTNQCTMLEFCLGIKEYISYIENSYLKGLFLGRWCWGGGLVFDENGLKCHCKKFKIGAPYKLFFTFVDFQCLM